MNGLMNDVIRTLAVGITTLAAIAFIAVTGLWAWVLAIGVAYFTGAAVREMWYEFTHNDPDIL